MDVKWVTDDFNFWKPRLSILFFIRNKTIMLLSRKYAIL